MCKQTKKQLTVRNKLDHSSDDSPYTKDESF